MTRLSKYLFLLLLTSGFFPLITGCEKQIHPVVKGPVTIEKLEFMLKDAHSKLQRLEADYTLNLDSGNLSFKVRGHYYLEPPDRFAGELKMMLGLIKSSLVINDGRYELFGPDGTVKSGDIDSLDISRYLAVDFHDQSPLELFMPLLLSLEPGFKTESLQMNKADSSWTWRLRYADSIRDLVLKPREGKVVSETVYSIDNELQFKRMFSDYSIIDGLILPRKIEFIFSNDSKSRATLKLSDPRINPKWKIDPFRLKLVQPS